MKRDARPAYHLQEPSLLTSSYHRATLPPQRSFQPFPILQTQGPRGQTLLGQECVSFPPHSLSKALSPGNYTTGPLSCSGHSELAPPSCPLQPQEFHKGVPVQPAVSEATAGGRADSSLGEIGNNPAAGGRAPHPGKPHPEASPRSPWSESPGRFPGFGTFSKPLGQNSV